MECALPQGLHILDCHRPVLLPRPGARVATQGLLPGHDQLGDCKPTFCQKCVLSHNRHMNKRKASASAALPSSKLQKAGSSSSSSASSKSGGYKAKHSSTSTNATSTSAQSPTKDLVVNDLRHASVREQKKFSRFQDQLREHPDYDDLALEEGMPIAYTLTLSDKKGNVKGFAAAQPEQDGMYLEALYTRKQNRGGGARMLQEVERLAKKQGKHRVFLTSYEDAVPFYQKHGYEMEFDEAGAFEMQKVL